MVLMMDFMRQLESLWQWLEQHLPLVSIGLLDELVEDEELDLNFPDESSSNYNFNSSVPSCQRSLALESLQRKRQYLSNYSVRFQFSIIV
ncbi:hypothetical protein CM15mP5_1340 [bacterium]|nr:MAG: hypothetical protein CM15mP5_1340 [bacterium]